MRKIIPFLMALLMLITVSNNYKEDYYIIPDESIRIRIVPNSNSAKDQYLKRQVKTNLEIELANDLKNSNSIETSRKIIKTNLNKYDNLVNEVLINEQIRQKYSIDYGYHHFPEKTYKGVKYHEGEYESLLVTLGQGKGDNWWCVLFPPICNFEENDQKLERAEYTFYVKEMFNRYFK